MIILSGRLGLLREVMLKIKVVMIMKTMTLIALIMRFTILQPIIIIMIIIVMMMMMMMLMMIIMIIIIC